MAPAPIPPEARRKSRRRFYTLGVVFLLFGSVYLAATAESFIPFKDRVTTLSLSEALATKRVGTQHAPTIVPYAHESFLTDFEITPENSAFLYGQFPREVFRIPGAASGTSRQFKIAGSAAAQCVTLEMEWSSPRDRPFHVAFDIEDRIGRPVFSAWGTTGLKRVNLRSGIYRIYVRYAGAIPEQGRFAMRALKVPECHANTLGYGEHVEDIPSLDISMPLVSAMQFNFVRQNHEKKLQQVARSKRGGQPIETSRSRVDANLRVNNSGAINKIKVWSAGAGDIMHFDKRRPSMTVSVLSGPLPFGMTRFKLYSVYTKQGILDFIAGKMIEKEGGFVPRWRLVWVVLNGRRAGLYVLEETPSPEFFIAKKRHRADIASLGKRYFKAKSPLGNPIEGTPFAMDNVAQRLRPAPFAKTVALLSRFHATHGLENTELRFFLDPLSGEYEAMVRDINVDYWARKGTGIRSLLVHGSWWIGDRFFAYGSHQNVKTGTFGANGFTCQECIAYLMTDRSLGLSAINPEIIEFIRIGSHRTLVEQNLLYYASQDYYRAFKKLLTATRKYLSPVMSVENLPLYSHIYTRSEKPFSSDKTDSSVANTIRSMQGKARAFLVPGVETGAYRRYFLYNFSPLSLAVTLPDELYASLTAMVPDCPVKQNTTLAPTSLFTQLTNRPEDPVSQETFSRLSNRLISLALNIERRRFETKYQALPFSPGARPYLAFCLAKGQETVLLNELRNKGRFSISGFYALDKDRLLDVTDMPQPAERNTLIEHTKNGTKAIEFPVRNELIFQQAGQFFIDGLHVLRYLVINQSSKEIRLPVAELKGQVFSGFWGGQYSVRNVLASSITERTIDDSNDTLVLYPAKPLPVEKTTGLWIDNLIALVSGPENTGTAQAAILDIYLSVDRQGNARKEEKISADVIIPAKPPHLAYLLERAEPSGHPFRVDEPHQVMLWKHAPMAEKDSAGSLSPSYLGDTVRLSNGRYDDLIVVGPDQTLELSPGQRILFGPNAGLLIRGTIRARGTPDAPITLMAAEDSWRGVLIVNNLEPDKINYLEYVNVARAAGGTYEGFVQLGAVSLIRSNAVLLNTVIDTPLSPDGINLFHARIKADGLKVINSFSDALDSDWSYGELRDSQFIACGGDCVDLNNSHFSISGVKVDRAADKAFSIGEGSTATFTKTTANGGRIGIALKDQSYITGSENSFNGFSIAPMVSYVKKAAFGFPDHNLRNSTFTGNPAASILEKETVVTRKYD